MSHKTLIRRHAAVRDDIADLTTRRPVPGPTLEHLNPFLFLNHHGPQVYRPGNRGLPFGPHPHRGFETVTFIIEGSLAHHDTGGHESVIRAGGVQWMTAGRGLVHAELSPDDFKRDGGPLEILQLWLNLPSSLKMTAPRYLGLQQDEIPAIALADGRETVHLVAGEYNGTIGPVHSLTGTFMATVSLRAGGRVGFVGLAGRVPFVYVVRGAVRIEGEEVTAFNLAQLSDDGDALVIAADRDALVLVGHADPIDEPVVAHGPFVMNSAAEIRQAIADYQAGAFG